MADNAPPIPPPASASGLARQRPVCVTPGGDHFMWMIYGLQKVGKSLTVADFCPGALVLGPSTSVWDGAKEWFGIGGAYTPGFTYKVMSVWTLTDVYNILMSMIKEGYVPPLLVIEDFNTLAKNSEVDLARKGYANYELIAALRNQVFTVLGLCRTTIGTSTIILAHEGKEEHSVRGRAVRGGPLVTGQLVEDMCLSLDGVIRMVLDPASPRKPIGSVFRTVPDPNWIQGFRGGISHGAPGNLRECLLASGYTIPRLRGLEWQDGVAEDTALRAVAYATKRSLLESIKLARQEVMAGPARERFNPDPTTGAFRHFRAALQAGGDRAMVRLFQARSIYADLGLDIPPELAAGSSVGFGPAPAAAAAAAPAGSPAAVTVSTAGNPFAGAPAPSEPVRA